MEAHSFDDLRDYILEVNSAEPEPGQVDDWEMLPGPHPIHQLPPEVLSEIFIECLPAYSAAPNPTRAPMLLAAICRDWREIALSTPSLWCSFILSVDLVKTVDGSAVIRLFETWLSRGGSYPLTMVINGVASSANYALPASFILALSQSSSRWRDVNLMLPLADFYRLQANEGLTQLKRLSITATANTAGADPESPLPPLNLFSAAPLLQDVCLGYGFSLDNIILSLHQLTYFESRAYAPAAHYLKVACAAPGLQEIRLNLNTSGTWGRSDAVRSNIKALHLLSMTEKDNDILDCLTCPALETLLIRGFYNPILPQPLTPFHFPGLHRFLARSSAALRELVLEFPSNLPDAFVETVQILTALPSLERLDIQPLAGNTAQDIFVRMCDSTSMFLPRLRVLTVQVNVCQIRTSWTYDAMTRMLVARWNKQVAKDVEQLQVFTFGFSPVFWASEFRPFPQPDSATFEQLEELTRQGMDLELVTVGV
ncbi:F-box domain-containing protein [Mycena sanguinolenta]|uniref:F-box domain-containing protein n=1 Tax=Mycena sanguinolenta TaxID=230812 RepID=A0A8H6Z720_9AGAR|nr:F-box domain-containing protein [Mycena sanguinolenta]